MHNFCYKFFGRLCNQLSRQTASAASTKSISVEFYLTRHAVDNRTLTDAAPQMKWNQSLGGNCSYWKDNSLKEIARKVTKMALDP